MNDQIDKYENLSLVFDKLDNLMMENEEESKASY